MEKRKKFWLLLTEAVILFTGIPMLFFWDFIPLPKLFVLVLAAGYCGYQLWQDTSFAKGLFQRENHADVSRVILIRSLVVIVGLISLIWILHPDQLLLFPSEKPGVWMTVMVLYPILSALPQEFIFRTYFFHRYGDILSLKYATVLASAVAFSFLHIIYDNWWAVSLSFIAGILFGLTYLRTRSLFWVTVEHAIYGCLVFTLGMGDYFYEGFG